MITALCPYFTRVLDGIVFLTFLSLFSRVLSRIRTALSQPVGPQPYLTYYLQNKLSLCFRTVRAIMPETCLIMPDNAALSSQTPTTAARPDHTLWKCEVLKGWVLAGSCRTQDDNNSRAQLHAHSSVYCLSHSEGFTGNGVVLITDMEILRHRWWCAALSAPRYSVTAEQELM